MQQFGKNVVVGNSTELKNVIIFNNAQVPHYNYVGDSILGYKSHLGAGSIISNLKSDKSLVYVKCDGEKIETKLKKFGAILGDNVEIGCGSVLNPGTIIGRKTNIYPLSSVRGYIGSNKIYKNQNEIVEKNIKQSLIYVCKKHILNSIFNLIAKLTRALHLLVTW